MYQIIFFNFRNGLFWTCLINNIRSKCGGLHESNLLDWSFQENWAPRSKKSAKKGFIGKVSAWKLLIIFFSWVRSSNWGLLSILRNARMTQGDKKFLHILKSVEIPWGVKNFLKNFFSYFRALNNSYTEYKKSSYDTNFLCHFFCLKLPLSSNVMMKIS